VRSGETILLHAAAGGVGLIACQWLKALGATVIGTAGRRKSARSPGARRDHCINYRKENFVERVKALTGERVCRRLRLGGQGYLHGSLDCLQPRGLMVSFGNASGAVPPSSWGRYRKKDRCTSRADPGDLHWQARRSRGHCEGFVRYRLLGQGEDRDQSPLRLKDAAQAHRDLEARKTTDPRY